MTTRRLLRGVAGRPRRTGSARARRRSRARAAPAHRRRARRGRGGRRAARPRRPGRQRRGPTAGRALAPSTRFSPRGDAARPRRRPTTDLERIVGDFATPRGIAVDGRASTRSRSTSATATCCSSFLSPKLNQRDDEYGGSLENRARLRPRGRAGGARARSAAGVAVTAKLNMADGVRGGLWLDESVEVAQLLEADGALDALELTGGSSLENPMYLFRGDAPMAEMAATHPPPLRLGLKLIGKRFLRELPVRGGVLPALRPPVPRRAVDAADPARRHQPARHRGAGAGRRASQFVAMGRALLREPT